jgi:hypothetical protein
LCTCGWSSGVTNLSSGKLDKVETIRACNETNHNTMWVSSVLNGGGWSRANQTRGATCKAEPTYHP